jgi:hypothetical protein
MRVVDLDGGETYLPQKKQGITFSAKRGSCKTMLVKKRFL